MGVRFIKIAVVYFVIGALLGLYMFLAEDYDLKGVYLNIHLLGWSSFALAGLVYHLFPGISNNVYEKLHFWCANIGLPVMLIALVVSILNGADAATIFTSIGGVIVAFSIIMFAINVLMNVRAKN